MRGLKDAFAAKQLLMTEDALRETMGAHQEQQSEGEVGCAQGLNRPWRGRSSRRDDRELLRT